MKSSLFLAVFAAGSAAFAASATIKSRQDQVSIYGLVVLAQGSWFQGSVINANGLGFWIGKNTSTYCPVDPAYCDTFKNVTTIACGGEGYCGMNTAVPGGQELYLGTDNALTYTQAHSANSYSGSLTNFTVSAQTGHFKWDGYGWQACSTASGIWQVFSIKPGPLSDSCMPFKILAITNPDFVGAGAWQYD